MRLRHIEVFQAIRQTGSISGAAQLLHVTQPAVSKILQHAEAQLGFPLFLRVRGKLQITPEALALEREVDKVSDSVEGVRRLAASLRRQPGMTLRMGATPALALSLFPPVISQWAERHPQSECELSSLHSRELVQQLLMREIDVALTLRHPEHPGLNVQPLAHGMLVVLAPRGYWSEDRQGVPLAVESLADAPLIGLSSSDPLAAQVGHYLKNLEPAPLISIRVQTYSLARAMVESGAGLALIDPFTAQDSARTLVRPLNPALPITLYALTRANESHPHTLDELLEHFAERAREQIARVTRGV
ncbi:LysR family transcriptional regulator [Pseudomonas wadenswilerensis]|uniref:LysR family transcriptional regulator n=1 Tax=Pseudomonas wadenswilerensis TaxID=1785161 RepID=UPI003207FCD6